MPGCITITHRALTCICLCSAVVLKFVYGLSVASKATYQSLCLLMLAHLLMILIGRVNSLRGTWKSSYHLQYQHIQIASMLQLHTDLNAIIVLYAPCLLPILHLEKAVSPLHPPRSTSSLCVEYSLRSSFKLRPGLSAARQAVRTLRLDREMLEVEVTGTCGIASLRMQCITKIYLHTP